MNQYDFSVELKSTGKAEALKDLELAKKTAESRGIPSEHPSNKEIESVSIPLEISAKINQEILDLSGVVRISRSSGMSFRFYEVPDGKDKLVQEWFDACQQNLSDKVSKLIIQS
ncbi:hypothetical protein [Nostoc sp.]